MTIPLSKPDITQKEIDAVIETLKTGVLSIGPKVMEFEEKVARYVGVKHAVAVNSGTGGLHLLVRAFGIREGDEVITTPFSFIASSNCILFEGAKPVFADIDSQTMEMDMDRVESCITGRTKALLAVDVFGHPVNIRGLREIADRRHLILIEDACEALGSEYLGIKSGSQADGAVFAFYPNKQITTAEGGMIVTNREDIAELCCSYRSQGRAKTGLWLTHDRLGYNYRMSELHAALGSAQMDRLEEIIRMRQEVAMRYNEQLGKIPGVLTPSISPDVSQMSWFVYVIRLDAHLDRNRIMQYLLENGVSCRPYFTPIHLQQHYRQIFGYREGDFPVTERVAATTIALPFFNHLTREETDRIAAVLKDGVERYG